jgi:hypothetical protein
MKMAAGNNKPLARTHDVLTERLGAELVVYDTRSKRAHNLGSLAACVFARCDGRTAVRELVRLASTELGERITLEQVQQVLGDLESLSLLDTAMPDGFSRRAVMRRGAIAGAAVLATPFVTSVTTPAFAANCAGGCSTYNTCVKTPPLVCAGGTSLRCLCQCGNGGPLLTTPGSSCPGGQAGTCICIH